MSKVRVSASISIDGFGAGPQPSLENPQGVGGLALAEWAFATRTFQRMHGTDWAVQDIHHNDEGTTGIDDDFFARGFRNVGAWILGRNMFGPVRDRGVTTPGRAGGETRRRGAPPCSC